MTSSKTAEQAFSDIEQNQAALRRSIEYSKQLAAQSDELIENHKKKSRRQAGA